MAITKIPDQVNYENWLKKQGYTDGSIKSYKSYLRRCIETIMNNGFNLGNIISQYVHQKSTVYLIAQLDICYNIIVNNLTSKEVSGFNKYVEYLLGNSKSYKTLFSGSKVKLISAPQFIKDNIRQRFVSDSRPGYPMKTLIPLFRKQGLPIEDIIQEACENLVVLTQNGVVHLKCISYLLYVSKPPYAKADVYVVIKELGEATRVWGYLSPKNPIYNPNNHIIEPMVIDFYQHNNHCKEETKQLTREHYPEISHLVKYLNISILKQADFYNKNKTLKSQTPKFINEVFEAVKRIESIITYTLMLKKENISKGNGRGSKRKS